MRDVNKVVRVLLARYPDLKVQQLEVKHPFDDEGLWFFTHPSIPFQVQVETPTGNAPFLVETTEHNERYACASVRDLLGVLTHLLHLSEQR
jgi:hypothetical protein